jgi:hypothetical protein
VTVAEPLEPVVEPPTRVVVRTQPMVEPVEAPRKRRRWLGWLIALLVLVVLLVVGFFVADAYAKDYAKGYVRDQIVKALNLDPASQVDVDLGGGSVIAQAIAGSISEVTVNVAELPIGDVTGSAVITATGVPLDSTKPVETLGVEATISEANVQQLAGYLSGIDLKTIKLGNGVITVGTEFPILGLFVLPVSVDLEPSAVDGGISFDPKTIILNGQPISVEDLRNTPQVAALAGDLLKSRDFCVASSLPKALTITDVTVVGSDLVITITGDGTALGGPDMAELGVCKDK